MKDEPVRKLFWTTVVNVMAAVAIIAMMGITLAQVIQSSRAAELNVLEHRVVSRCMFHQLAQAARSQLTTLASLAEQRGYDASSLRKAARDIDVPSVVGLDCRLALEAIHLTASRGNGHVVDDLLVEDGPGEINEPLESSGKDEGGDGPPSEPPPKPSPKPGPKPEPEPPPETQPPPECTVKVLDICV